MNQTIKLILLLMINCTPSVVVGDLVQKEKEKDQCFKNDCVNDTNVDLIQLFKRFPLTIMENSTAVSPQCQHAYARFLEGVKKHNYDDVKMLDATGKLSSGLLNGNVNQFGDFDECMELSNAQYCLADVDVKHLMTGPLERYKNRIHSHFAIVEDFTDKTHRTPGFANIRWGFCIPKECSSDDLKTSLENTIGVKVLIREHMCQSNEIQEDTSFGYKFTRWYFITIISLVILATVFNNLFQSNSNYFTRFIYCFSIQRNWNNMKTVKDENDKNDFAVVHGLRALSAIGLLVSHKSMALQFNPYMNRTKFVEMTAAWWSVFARNAVVYTENFIGIAGLLNANAMFNDLQKHNELKLKDKMINRLFRIVPNFLTIILFYTYIMPQWNSGPQWPLVVKHHSELCKQYMWRNMLFIHNYFGFENMCMNHTHQIGTDMQLYLVTPIFVLLLWRKPKLGLIVAIAAGLLSTFLRFWATYTYSLSYIVYFGISVSSLFNVANYSYILPTHRATVYLAGIILAYSLKKRDPNTQYSNVHLLLFWSIFFPCIFSCWFGPYYMGLETFKYDHLEQAIYAAFCPLAWSVVGIYFLYLAINGHGGWFGAIFSWNRWKYFTKIAYSFYLVQFPIFFYNVGKRKYVEQYSPSILFELYEVTEVVLWSITLTLFVEMPFQNLKKVLFNQDVVSTKPKTEVSIRRSSIKA